jgi:hypothetical protein
MNGDDYVIDGDLAFSNSKDALKFYQTEYHKQQEHIEKLKDAYGKQCTRANELACQVRDLKNENVELQKNLNMAHWMIGKMQEK